MNTFNTWEEACEVAATMNAKSRNTKGAWFPKNLRGTFVVAWLKNCTEHDVDEREQRRARR